MFYLGKVSSPRYALYVHTDKKKNLKLIFQAHVQPQAPAVGLFWKVWHHKDMSNELGYTSIYGDDGDDNEWTFFLKKKNKKLVTHVRIMLNARS